VIWNTREVKNAIGKILLHVDASQAPYTEKIERSHFGADILVFDSVKIGGPRAMGCLIAHRTLPLAPLTFGGGQERGLRPGTENPEAAAGFARALGDAVRGRTDFAARAELLRGKLAAFITDSVREVYINEGPDQAQNILNLSLPGRDTDYLVALLDDAGYAVSTRSACETDSEEGSRAVYALTGDPERAKSTLRISWGPSVPERDLMRFAAALSEAVAFVDNADLG
jgi:cysteine desulfurase